MNLVSNSFNHKEDIPKKHAYHAENVSPALDWGEIPVGTKSLAISCVDPDGGNWVHWYVYDIPPTVIKLHEGQSPPGIEVINDFGKIEYGGPCPPSGKHRYVFTVYALDVGTLEDVTKENFIRKVKKHTIESAKLIGMYEKDRG